MLCRGVHQRDVERLAASGNGNLLILFQFPVEELKRRIASCLGPATKLRLLWLLYAANSGHYIYRKFNIQQFYVLPTQLYLCFVWIWEQTVIISLYSINWLVCITEI